MDKAQIKKVLAASRRDPVSCAVGISGGHAVILLDRIKKPKALEQDLSKQFPDLKNARWGTASVDTEENPGLVVLTLNKAASGLAQSLKKSLKGTGYSQVEIRLEDGSVAEKIGDEDEAEAPVGTQQPATAAGDAAAPPQAQAPDGTAGAGTAPAQPNTGQPDTGDLTRRLTDLVKQAITAIAGDPSRKVELGALAAQAQAALKAGDPASATSAIEHLQAALAGGATAATAGTSASPAAGVSPAAVAKARVAWTATRQKVESDIGKLQDAFTAAFKGHPAGPDLGTAFKARADKVLDSLDEALAHKLDEVAGATDPAQHARLVQEAQQIIQRYEATVASDPTIAALDENPFVPVAIRQTMTATLSALSKAIR
jgi:hypothetical protein